VVTAHIAQVDFRSTCTLGASRLDHRAGETDEQSRARDSDAPEGAPPRGRELSRSRRSSSNPSMIPTPRGVPSLPGRADASVLRTIYARRSPLEEGSRTICKGLETLTHPGSSTPSDPNSAWQAQLSAGWKAVYDPAALWAQHMQTRGHSTRCGVAASAGRTDPAARRHRPVPVGAQRRALRRAPTTRAIDPGRGSIRGKVYPPRPFLSRLRMGYRVGTDTCSRIGRRSNGEVACGGTSRTFSVAPPVTV